MASQRVCTFALIAAHGALWANWYLRCARLAAIIFALCDLKSPLSLREKIAQFDDFTHSLREINRQVMVATFEMVHCLTHGGPSAAIARGFPEDICNDMHAAMEQAKRGEPVGDDVKRDLYLRHFRWEQKRVVGTILQECFDRFTWTFMRNICLRPWVWFAYFRPGRSMNFRNFMDEEERVAKILIAFDRASRSGWGRTERRLRLAFWSLARRPRA